MLSFTHTFMIHLRRLAYTLHEFTLTLHTYTRMRSYTRARAQVGFRLGEDLASTNCVLVHSSVKTQIEAVGGLSGFTFEPSDAVDIEGTRHEVWSVK